MVGIGSKHPYFTCRECGCLQIESMPESMAEYYQSGYYSFSPPQDQGLRRYAVGLRNRYAVLRKGLVGRLLFRALPTPMFDFLGAARHELNIHSKILDVGCGAGALLQAFRRAGFGGAQGVDPFVERHIDMDGSRLVTRGTLDQMPGGFDLIMFHHSLEHMPDQAATLRLAHDKLRARGWCVVRVPLSSSLAWERYGTDWVQLDAPRHFYLHTPQSMRLVATHAGFSCLSVDFDSTAFQFWGSEQYRRGIALVDERSYAVNPAASAFTAADIQTFEQESQALNHSGQGDQAIFLFRKR